LRRRSGHLLAQRNFQWRNESKLAEEANRGSHMRTGKGWRLLTPKQDRVFKAALVTTFNSQGERYAVYRIAQGNGNKT